MFLYVANCKKDKKYKNWSNNRIVNGDGSV